MVKVIVCLLGLLLSQAALALPQITATIDKNPVMVNESFVLTVVADDDVNSNALDTSSLQKDFIVGRTSVSSQTSMVNFKTSYSTRWTTVLIPRTHGTVVIPPLTVDGQQTAPITLDVVAASSTNASAKKQDIFISTDVSAKDVYVQQLVTLSVKLHFSAELKRGSLSEPELEGASIKQIGKDQESENIINGKRYRVIERTYAITPQQSGEVVIKAPMFSGEIMATNNRRSNFFSFGETKPVSVVGEQVSLNVRPIPESFQGQWLPSELLTLHQEWQPELTQFTVGEPITRTITLTAAGLSEEQLPELTMDMPVGLKVYPDQPVLHTSLNKDRLVSQQVRNFALVASKPGKYTLPQVTIPWWNTITNRYETAKIAAQDIEVIPGAETAATTPFIPATASNSDSQAQMYTSVTIKENSWLTWLFLALWLLTSFAWLTTSLARKRNATTGTRPAKGADKRATAKVGDPYLALLAACKKNNGELVITLLPAWINATRKNNKQISSLDEVIKIIDHPDFADIINELQQDYYGKNHGDKESEFGQTSMTPWHGKKLLSLLVAMNKKRLTKAPEVAIALNP